MTLKGALRLVARLLSSGWTRSRRATFRLRDGGPATARVLLTLPDGATTLASSEMLKLSRR